MILHAHPVKPFSSNIDASRSRTTRPSQDADSRRRRRLRSKRILVVEDDQDSRELIETLLQLEGARVRTASSAAEALAALHEDFPDLLLSDIGMPEHDGYWLIEQVRRQWPALPAVALTAFTRDEDAERALRAGFNQHLGKPVEPELLIRTVVTWADGSSTA